MFSSTRFDEIGEDGLTSTVLEKKIKSLFQDIKSWRAERSQFEKTVLDQQKSYMLQVSGIMFSYVVLSIVLHQAEVKFSCRSGQMYSLLALSMTVTIICILLSTVHGNQCVRWLLYPGKILEGERDRIEREVENLGSELSLVRSAKQKKVGFFRDLFGRESHHLRHLHPVNNVSNFVYEEYAELVDWLECMWIDIPLELMVWGVIGVVTLFFSFSLPFREYCHFCG